LSSYFSDPDSDVEHFSIGFDLAGRHLPESAIIQAHRDRGKESKARVAVLLSERAE